MRLHSLDVARTVLGMHDVAMPGTRRGPANVQLRRAQIALFAGAAAVVLSAPIGIILLTLGSTHVVDLVAGILLLVFSSAGIVAVIAGWMYLRRGAAAARSQQDFLTSVSHELRTPMTSMRMFVDALLDDRLTDERERARCLQTLRIELQRLDGLLGQLIDLSRLETRPGPITRQDVPVSEIVNAALDAHRALLLAGGNSEQGPLELDFTDDLIVRGDRDALIQALVNLLANAWKHGGRGARVRIHARHCGDREVEVAVLDQGPGLPADERRAVLEKFSRGRHAVESGIKGSGLGLSIVDGIVRAHGGRIELRATDPNAPAGAQGCAVHLFLPRARQAAARHRAAS